MKTKTVKVATFKVAFEKFLSYLPEDSFNLNILSSFSELKEKKVIHYTHRESWCGNHHSSSLLVELFMVDKPLEFYIVRTTYDEISDNSHRAVATEVFVPN